MIRANLANGICSLYEWESSSGAIWRKSAWRCRRQRWEAFMVEPQWRARDGTSVPGSAAGSIAGASGRPKRPPLAWFAAGLIAAGAAIGFLDLGGTGELLRYAFIGSGLGLLMIRRRG
jgi:hypothetical protein